MKVDYIIRDYQKNKRNWIEYYIQIIYFFHYLVLSNTHNNILCIVNFKPKDIVRL